VTENSAKYFETLGINSPPEPRGLAGSGTAKTKTQPTDYERDARLAALTRAHDIRQFEIELYWKRANYFWLLQAAVFAAIGLIWKSNPGHGTEVAAGAPAVISVALSALGTIAAAAGWYSAKGSKFWQENWEHHIDMLEDEFEGSLHKTAYVGVDGTRWSVSGVNDRLSACFWVFWWFMLIATTHTVNRNWTFGATSHFVCPSLTEIATVASWMFAFAGTLALRDRVTNFHGQPVHYPKATIAVSQSETQPHLIRREPKI
jgi:hypothetical protein